MSKFKGTEEKWLRDGNLVFAEDYFQSHIASTCGAYTTDIEEANAQLISKAPEMLAELNETLIDLKILRNQISESNKLDHRWDGMMDLVDKWIDRKEQLIKEATTI